MEAIVAERGQITLPKAVRDALGLTKGTQLKVELDGSRIILRKDVSEALRKARGRFKLVDGLKTTDQAMRASAAARRATRSTNDRCRFLGADRRADRRPEVRRRVGNRHRRRLAAGEVVVCDAVVAEVQAMLDTSVSLMETLNGFGIRFGPTTEQAAMRAGHMNKRFRSRGGKRERVVADFLIGAHALLQCEALVTRDDGFFRDYFKGLKLIVPKSR